MKRFFRFRCRICMKMLWAKTSGKDNYADKVERRTTFADYICILHPFHILIFGKKCENDLMIHTNVILVIRFCLHLRKKLLQIEIKCKMQPVIMKSDMALSVNSIKLRKEFYNTDRIILILNSFLSFFELCMLLKNPRKLGIHLLFFIYQLRLFIKDIPY